MYSQAINTYREQIAKYKLLLKEQKKQHQIWSMIRLFGFLALVALIILAFNTHYGLGIFAIYLAAFVFVKIMKRHEKISKLKDKSTSIIQTNEDEITFLNNLNSFRDKGEPYKDNAHPYSSDLDIFGENSLFQYIERTCTRYGRDKLAQRLTTPLLKEDILVNQEAVSELTSKLDWRQGFMAYDLKKKDDALDKTALLKWKETAPALIENRSIGIVRIVLPFIALTVFIILCYYIPWYLALFAFLPSILLQRKYADHISQLLSLSEHSLKYISSYGPLIEEIENGSFTSDRLRDLQAYFLKGNKTSKKLKSLDWYLEQIAVKHNIFGAIFNVVSLYDIHFTIRVEQWQAENKEDIDVWTDALAEFEFLQSLANLSYNNKQWTFPIIEGDVIDCVNIGHPLIAGDKRIANTISLPVHQHIKLITGSNMGGKSTFQRTIGMNMVLSYCGSKVCASKLHLPILKVLSSMRTQDDLSKDASGFYAELLRLKMVLEKVQTSENNYFFIDEILKGTNTDDRHKGSKALIKQLLRSNGAGLISTHDLELAKLEDTLNGQLENICFEVDVIDEKLFFDYTVKKGVSKSFNATKLMESIGIDISDES